MAFQAGILELPALSDRDDNDPRPQWIYRQYSYMRHSQQRKKSIRIMGGQEREPRAQVN